MRPTLPFHREWSSRGTQPAVCSKPPAIVGSLAKLQAGRRTDVEEVLEWSQKTEPAGAVRGSTGIVTGKEGEAVEAPTAHPPLWEPSRNLVPGSRCVRVAAPPRTVFKSLGEFFRCHLAAEVSEHAWAMTITAFLDYVAVNMKVAVHRDAAAESHTVVMFQHISQDDIIQFNHVCSLAVKHISTSSLQVSELGGVRCAPSMLIDDGFDDDLFEGEEDWPAMIERAFEAVSCLEKSTREQGIQALARWAELRPDCMPALADALVKHGCPVGEVLNGPLAESYPLAAILKFASRRPQEAERLAERILPLLPWPKAVLPSLVARELQEVFKNLITATAAATKPTYKAAEDPKEPPEDLSPTSTCTEGPWGFSSSWSESSKASTWEPIRPPLGPQLTQLIREESETLVLSEGEDDFTGSFI